MKRPSVNTRDRRALTLGAAMLLPSLLFVYGVQPYWRTLTAIREQTDNERLQLARDEAVAGNLSRFPAAKAGVARQLGVEVSRLFPGDNDLVATGGVAEYVAHAAGSNGVQIQQIETRPARPLAPGVRALQVEVRAEGDLPGILPFLRDLERGNKLVRIGRLSVERRQGAVDTARMGNVEVLSVSASVYGYRITTPTPKSSPGDSLGMPSPFVRMAYDLPSVDAVLDRDPFNPSRTRPSPSYQVAISGQQQVGTPGRSSSPLQLVGTVVSADGSGFAMCQTGNDAPRIVKVGGQIAGYTLSSLGRGRAVFTTATGGRLELRVSQPGMGS